MLHVFVHVPKCAGGTIQSHIEIQYPPQERLILRPRFQSEEIARLLSAEERALWAAGAAFRRAWVTAYAHSLPVSSLSALRCIAGHAAYYGVHESFGQPARYFTFLREPLARFVSYYNYIRSARVSPQRLLKNEIQREDGSLRSVDEWLAEADLPRYSMSAFLNHSLRAENLLQEMLPPDEKEFEEVKAMLAGFYFIGLTENKEDMDFAFQTLGLTHSLPDKNVLSGGEAYQRPRDPAAARQLVAARYPMDVELYEFAHRRRMTA